HGHARAVAIFRRSRDVVSVAAHAEADQLRINARAALLRMLQLFENDGAAAIREHEAIAIGIPRTARLLRRIVPRGEGLRLAEAAEAASRGRHLAAASDDDVRVTVLNGAHAEPDGVRRRRAGRDDAEVRTLQVV